MELPNVSRLLSGSETTDDNSSTLARTKIKLKIDR
jgi:hypothetical protein